MNTPYRILAIDDNRGGLLLLEKLLTPEFEFRGVTSGDQALEIAPEYRPHLVLLDLIMPGLDGCLTCKALAALPELSETKIVILSGRTAVEDRLAPYECGAVDYIVKPFHDHEVATKVRTWLKMAHRHKVDQVWTDLDDAQDGLGQTLTSLVKLRDSETGEHLFRMRWYCQTLAEQLAVKGPYQAVIDERFIKQLFRASPLHDIGKIGIEDAILRKHGWLTPEEYEEMKRHTAIGAEILATASQNLPYADYLPMAVSIARSHHERFDGSGYPDGLNGASIPLAARIVSVADVFDAVSSDRVYRNSMSMGQAARIIEHGAGTLFDPAVVDAFRERLGDIKQAQLRFNLMERAAELEASIDYEREAVIPRQNDHCQNDLMLV